MVNLNHRLFVPYLYKVWIQDCDQGPNITGSVELGGLTQQTTLKLNEASLKLEEQVPHLSQSKGQVGGIQYHDNPRSELIQRWGDNSQIQLYKLRHAWREILDQLPHLYTCPIQGQERQVPYSRVPVQ